MKLITRDTDYAVKAVCHLARYPRRRMSVADLSRELKMPRPFLRKILQALNRAGILESSKGLGGGFRMNKNAREILLTDMMRIFQGPLTLNECLFKKRLCPNRGTCALKKTIGELETYVLARLNKVSIASLLG